jgi:AraC-like DNA-binding protein
VEAIWYAQDWKPAHAAERHMPDGAVNLIVSLGGDGAAPAESSMLIGARTEASFLDTSAPYTVIGAYFKRGGAFPFVDVPLTELTNIEAALADVAGAPTLRDQLLDAREPQARLRRLQDWLMRRLMRARQGDPAIAWAVEQFEREPHLRVSAVAEHIGRSSRWFTDRFAAEVGLTPKAFSRITRFHGALRQLHAGTHLDLADLAASAGYYDQAHFTHDFHAIAGITPSAYLSARTAHPNHVAILD